MMSLSIYFLLSTKKLLTKPAIFFPHVEKLNSISQACKKDDKISHLFILKIISKTRQFLHDFFAYKRKRKTCYTSKHKR